MKGSRDVLGCLPSACLSLSSAKGGRIAFQHQLPSLASQGQQANKAEGHDDATTAFIIIIGHFTYFITCPEPTRNGHHGQNRCFLSQPSGQLTRLAG